MRIAGYLLVALTCVGAGAGAQSPDQVAIIGCRNAATREARAQRPEADSVRFTSEPRVTEKSARERSVRGAARYFDRGRREWRPFIYDCVYHTRSAATSVRLQFDGSAGTE
jgi:hypothetical protein